MRRYIHFSTFTFRQQRDAVVQPLRHLLRPNPKPQRFLPCSRRIKQHATAQISTVMHNRIMSFFWIIFTVARSKNFHRHTIATLTASFTSQQKRCSQTIRVRCTAPGPRCVFATTIRLLFIKILRTIQTYRYFVVTSRNT